MLPVRRDACQERRQPPPANLPAAHEAGKGQPERLFHIRVEGAHAPEYWLDLEISASTTLTRLDDYLRAIWLECCGHLSAFEIDGIRYEVATEGVDFDLFAVYDEPPKPMKSARLGRILRPGLTFLHEYDFGSTTELKLKVAVNEPVCPPPRNPGFACWRAITPQNTAVRFAANRRIRSMSSAIPTMPIAKSIAWTWKPARKA